MRRLARLVWHRLRDGEDAKARPTASADIKVGVADRLVINATDKILVG